MTALDAALGDVVAVVPERCSSAITRTSRGFDLVVGEEDGLAADREVAALRPADVVLGHQDPPQVGVAAEDDPEEVVDLALLELGGREELDAGVELGELLDGGRRRSSRRRGWVHQQRLDVIRSTRSRLSSS